VYELARRFPGSEIIGIDTNAEMIRRNNRIAQKAGLRNCTFEVADISCTGNFPGLNCIISIDVLEHIEDDVSVLKKYESYLEHGGKLILHVPGYYRRGLSGGLRVNFPIEGHVRPGYRKEDILQKISGCGFRIIDHHYTYGFLETFANTLSYIITRARMKNKLVYAVAFPILSGLSYLGRKSKPAMGAGILVVAEKE
jgi:cyclopropane fatty-acyl-phospholipid synthase-like methyltransferase